MRVTLHSFDIDAIQKPSDVSDVLWNGWKEAVVASTKSSDSSSSSAEYRFTELKRSNLWTAVFTSFHSSRLELQISKSGAVWSLFAMPPAQKGLLRDALEKPIARMRVNPDVKGQLFTNGLWKVCVPTTSRVELTILGVGQKLASWRARLGLKGSYESEVRYEKLQISVHADDFDELKSMIDGEYVSLPKCGGACGSLHKRQQDGSRSVSAAGCEMFFFLESGRCSLGDDDTYVFSPDKDRTSYGQFREISLKIDPKLNYRPEFQRESESSEPSRTLQALVEGSWVEVIDASLKPVLDTAGNKQSTIMLPVESPRVALSPDGWKTCPVIIEAQISLKAGDLLFQECEKLQSRSKKSRLLEVNLQKSISIFRCLAFATSRLSVPDSVARNWLALDSSSVEMVDGEEVACEACAPTRPEVKWTIIQKGSSLRVFYEEPSASVACDSPNPSTRGDAGNAEAPDWCEQRELSVQSAWALSKVVCEKSHD